MFSGLDLLLVRGAPGIGKSTIGSLFRRFAHGGVVIDIDDVRRMTNDELFLYGENEHYRNAIVVVQGMVESYLVAGYSPVIVIDVFCANILNLFRAKIYPGPAISATLYAQNSVLLGRMRDRIKGYINLEVAERVNCHMLDTREMTDIWIDTTNFDSGESFKMLILAVKQACLEKYGLMNKEEMSQT